MAKARLTDKEVDQIVGLLTAWKGRLNWELLLEQVEALLRRPFTRQGLDKQELIKTAFQLAKARVRRPPGAKQSTEQLPEIMILERRIESLRAENEVLRTMRGKFDEKFATWLYNARSRGLSEAELNRPLPDIDRNPSAK